MADYVITIAVSINIAGCGLPVVWGTNTANHGVEMIWGVSNWATDEVYVEYGKNISNTQAVTSAVDNKSFIKGITESITVSDDVDNRYLQDGKGYFYVYPNNTTDTDDEVFSSYSAYSPSTSTWSTQTVTTTTWI